MKRRTALAASLGLAIASRAVFAQERMRRIAVLVSAGEKDAEGQARISGLRQGLQALGWVEGRNIALIVRFGEGDARLIRDHTNELVAMAPDLIVVNSTPALDAAFKATKTLPVVFMLAIDPVGLGFIDSLAKPGGNITGFTFWDGSLIGKWLQLLKDAAPSVERATIVHHPDNTPYYPRMIKAAQALPNLPPIALSLAQVRQPEEIERVVSALGREPRGALLVPSDPFNLAQRNAFAQAALTARLPLISIFRAYGAAGALMTYGPDVVDVYRRSASYVDRILKGAKPGDLPAQAPTQYEFVVNAGTARKLGITIPPTMLALADEVIE